MRPILLVFVVFAVGIFLGHEFWPNSHPDPAGHFRFHRGKMPYEPDKPQTTNKPPTQHGRILHKPQNGVQPQIDADVRRFLRRQAEHGSPRDHCLNFGPKTTPRPFQ